MATKNGKSQPVPAAPANQPVRQRYRLATGGGLTPAPTGGKKTPA